ncbi:MAG: hypothetical protein JSV16_14810 [Candidatus Hydrogenedentota bacterium]|nr:MAG: hypothetical protein JSV16_14810 [Candidatus Hydrogenedentota bacterium]
MKETVHKIVFFVLSMLLLFLIYRCALYLKESESPYMRFPDKIETFR